MDNILITAFDPFGGDDTNSSQIVLNLLPDEIENVIINKMVVPTVYKECAHLALERAKEVKAFCVIALGQAAKSEAIRIETIGVNYAIATIADNKGTLINGEKLSDSSPDAHFSTIPVKEIVSSVNESGVACTQSLSAGGFVCNSMLYTLLDESKNEHNPLMCGFIHLPCCESQNKDFFTMEDDTIARAVTEAIKTVIKSYRERKSEICAE